MKSFEEEFPSLKGKRINEPDCEKCSHGKIFFDKVIQEHCKDNQIIKEAIEKVLNYGSPRECNIEHYLFEELGLE